MLEIKKVSCQSELDDALAIRTEVFVDEQHVKMEEEIDGLDGQAIHYNVYRDEKIIGTLRVFIHADYAKIGRVCIRKSERGQGIGKLMMKQAEAEICYLGITEFHLDAQVSALGFYKGLGYVEYGDTFLDANIPHIHMKKFIR